MRYRVVDWAGNDLINFYGTFTTFEDAWGAIYEQLPDQEEFDDFFVLLVNEEGK